MKNNKTLCIGLVCLFLSACHVLPPKTNSVSPSNLVQQFAAEGKAALRYPRCDEYRGCKEEAFSANLHWLHQNNGDELSLYDPTGQEAVKIRYQGEQVQLYDKEGEKTLTRAELRQVLGVPIPVEKLLNWFLIQRAESKFFEEGWQIEAEQWQGQYYRRLTIKQDAYYLRLILDRLVPF